MRAVILVLVVALLVHERAIASTKILETATYGGSAQVSFGISSEEAGGARFEVLGSDFAVESIGANILAFAGDGVYGTIVRLSGPGAFPTATWATDGSVMGVNTFTPPPFSSADLTLPLTVTLAPGNYALLFGSGLFGATGVAGLTLNNPMLVDESDYFYAVDGNFSNTVISDGTVVGPGQYIRMFVAGEYVPEPSGVVMALFALAGMAIASYRVKRTNGPRPTAL